MERINKKLVLLGIASRRNADKMILENRVKINGKLAILGDKVSSNDRIEVDDKIIKNEKIIILAYNKEKGVICTESNIEKNIKISDKIKEFGFNKRLFTIGRLDKDTTGLIFITNDGDLARKITNSKNNYEKEYEVRVNKPIDDNFVKQIEEGIYLKDISKKTKPAKIILLNDEKYRFRIIITEGLNRQIRRMCSELGYRVLTLKRIRIINYKIGKLKPGEYKVIKEEDIFYDKTGSNKKNKRIN